MQDRFQASFWKLRQSEYEPYLLQRAPLRTKQVGPFSFDLYTWPASLYVRASGAGLVFPPDQAFASEKATNALCPYQCENG